jgi:hypothetical protein
MNPKTTVTTKIIEIFIFGEDGKQIVREIDYFQNWDNICSVKVNLNVEEEHILGKSCQTITDKIQM